MSTLTIFSGLKIKKIGSRGYKLPIEGLHFFLQDEQNPRLFTVTVDKNKIQVIDEFEKWLEFNTCWVKDTSNSFTDFYCFWIKPIINVANIRYVKEGIYIGRGYKNLTQSPLANPYKISDQLSREEVIKLYRKWLWSQMQNKNSEAYQELIKLSDIAKEKPICLLCWCKPEGCHGHIVKAAIEYLLKPKLPQVN